ncbi:hypothetical protein J6R97_05545 [bacterium]|nr:hypothetical protein [bacterium]
MRGLFKIVLLFFTLATLFLLEPNNLHSSSIEFEGFISRVKKESVVFVSNNIFNGEIHSNQQKDNQNTIGSTPLVLAYQSFGSSISKNITQLNGCFIHNLSTDKQKVHQIRAP